MSSSSRGLALPPPLILTSPQSANIDLLISPTSNFYQTPQPPPRLIIPSTAQPSSSSSRRAAPAPSSKGIQETRKLLHHLIDRLEDRAPSDGVFDKALERERRSGGAGLSEGNDDARDKTREEEQEQTMELVEQLRDILVISKGLVVFEEDPNQHLGPTPIASKPSSVPLLSRLLPLLTSLFSHEALYPTLQPRLTRPPHALQSTLLDICTLLIHSARSRRDEDTVLSVGTVAMGVWAGLGLGGLGGPEIFGGGVWGERVLRFWESFLRGGFGEEMEMEPPLKQERDVRAGLGRGKTTFVGGGGGSSSSSSMPAIQVSDASEKTSAISQGHSGWHLHASPTSPNFSSPSLPTRTQSSSTYAALDASHSSSTSSPPSSTSLIPSLLSHILETFPLPLKSPLLLTVFRVHTLIDLIVARKPDVSLDLLRIVAHGSPTARFGALCLLETFWPKSAGHLNVGKALPSFEYKKDLYLYEMGRPAATEPHDRRHHWIPWIVSSPSGTSSPSERHPFDLCRSCSHPVDGFVLHCTHCLDFIHHSCYHPTSSTSHLRYPSPSSPQTILTVTLTFCKVTPTRLGPTEKIERDLDVRTEFWLGEHHFRLSNIFSLSLCGICRLPLWGATMQAYRCSGPCSLMAHPRCLTSGGGRLGRCRGLKPSVEMFRIEKEKLRESFVKEFESLLISEEDLSSSSSKRPSFEETAVVSSLLRLQLQLFIQGIENGTLVLESSEGPRFELHEVVERLQAALEGGGLKRSKALSELVDLERTDSRILTGTQLADRIVFSRTFLSLLVLTLKSPAPTQSSSHPSASGSSLLQVVQPEPASPSSEELAPLSSHPFDVVPLSHLFSQLSTTFGITSSSTATTFLSHLHTLGAFERQDGQASLFPFDLASSSNPNPLSQNPLCSFVLPQGVDNSPVQVELLVAAIEACLSDLSVAVNEIGLGLMSKLCMPSGSSQSWVMDRLAGSVIKWMLEEEDRLIIIARDFVSLSRPIPGVAEVLEGEGHGPVAWSSNLSKEEFIKAAVSRGPNQVGAARVLGVNDYKVAKRSLIDRHCSNWLLRLHNCDRQLYAEIFYKACAISSPVSDINSSSNADPNSPGAEDPLQERVEFADMALRNVIRLSSLDVVYSVFDEILSVWMDDISAMSTPEKPVAFKSLPRLFNRSKTSRVQSRMSTASMSDELGGFDVFTAQSVDPWRVLVEVVESGEDGLRRGLRWITVLSQSTVSIPIRNLLLISSLVKIDGSLEAASEFVEACFAAAWFDPAGKQDLILVISDLFAQHASTLIECFELGRDVQRSLRFLRRVLGSLLLLYGCPREHLQLGKLVESEGVYSDAKGVSARTMSRYSVITRSLEVKIDVVETLQQLSEKSQAAAALVGQFLLGLLTKSAQVQALDSFVDKRIELLLSMRVPSCRNRTWHLFEADVPTSTRVSLLLRILSTNSRALRSFLDAKFEESIDVDSKCSTLEILFRIIIELNGDESASIDSDWRATVVEIFFRFFACLWDQRDERVRSKATILSASLFPPHFELVSQSWEAFLDQADSSERTRSISFLVQLHPYFPGWRILNWSVVWNLLFEEEYNVEQHTRAVGGERSSVYGLDDTSEDPATALLEAEHLRIQLLDLALLWVGDGIQIDLFSLLKVKHHVIKTIGFEHCEIFCIQFSNLDRFTPAALSVVSGLKRVLDCHHHLDLSPSAMGVVYLDEDHPSSHLVGAAFIDVVISVVNSKVGIKNLPYLEQRCWLESFLIIVYKHDFESDSLVHLEAPLLEALKTITYLSPSISPDNQQIIITTCKILLDQWDEAVVAKVISRLISNVSRLLNSFGLESTGTLAIQARSFIRSALKKFGERGVYLLQFKEASDPKAIDAGFDLFAILSAVFESTSELQQVYWDVMHSLLSVNLPRPAFSSILKSLHRFAEVAPPTRLPPDLITEFGTFFSRIARHTSTWKDQDLDPNPLLSVTSLVLVGSRSKTSVLLPDVFALLQTFVARFDVKKETISQFLAACTLVSTEQRPPISILLDAAEMGLRRMETMTPSTLGSLLECLVSLPPPNSTVNPRQPTLDPSRLLLLAPLALAFISSSPPHFHSNSDSIASLSAARLVLAADEIDSSLLGQLLVDQLASDENPDHLRVYNWLALAALTHPRSNQARRLLDVSSFATYTCSSTLALSQFPQDPSKPDRSAEHLSAGFAFMKLWLLLSRKGREVDSEDGIVVRAANESSTVEGKEGETWDSCWPAWERSLRLSEEETRRSPISTVLHSIFTDLCIFISLSHSSILLTSGPSLEHHLLLVRELSSSKLVAVKLRRALDLVRSGGAGEEGGSIAVEAAGAAEDLKAAERLRSLRGL
ncbi:hypothetical protein BDY24DRAFT_419079 [Mrakia frigida]|uniref:C1 domain-containing protein n=1 Tax=Mrakia frigida TaxID=29902 RepID=UPI003FCBF739